MISAVPYDSLLVAELAARIEPALGAAPHWRGNHVGVDEQTAALADSTRAVVVLHQRLWQHNAATMADARELRERTQSPALPVYVVSLDEEPIPSWLAESPHLTVRSIEIGQVADELEAVLLTAENPRRRAAAQTPADLQAPRPERFGERPPPYLDQPRSLSALRRALDEMGAELERRVQSEKGQAAERTVEFHSSPDRLVVQLAEVGLSFSWVPGRSGTVSAGRLLVIEWEGVVVHGRRMGVTRTASPGRERLFQPEATGPDNLRWRAADSNAGAYSSLDLANQAFAGALLSVGA